MNAYIENQVYLSYVFLPTAFLIQSIVLLYYGSLRKIMHNFGLDRSFDLDYQTDIMKDVKSSLIMFLESTKSLDSIFSSIFPVEGDQLPMLCI